MEAPSSWGKLEHAIAEAMQDAEQARREKIIGLSTVRIIADKLRAKGLVGPTSHAFGDCEEASVRPEPPSQCNCAGPGKGCLRGHSRSEGECRGNGECTC